MVGTVTRAYHTQTSLSIPTKMKFRPFSFLTGCARTASLFVILKNLPLTAANFTSLSKSLLRSSSVPLLMRFCWIPCRPIFAVVIIFLAPSPSNFRPKENLALCARKHRHNFFIFFCKQPSTSRRWNNITDFHTKLIYDGKRCASSPSDRYSLISRPRLHDATTVAQRIA